MRARLAFLALATALLGGSGIAQSTPGEALAAARAEYRAAAAEAKRLDAQAGQARDKASQLGFERQAAAARIAEAEARISALQVELAARGRAVAAAKERLAAKQAPAAALVGSLVSMGRRPPLLALADGRSPAELVRVRMLLDSTLPVIRARSAALASGLAQERRLAEAAQATATQLGAARAALAERQQRFATLEREANATAAALGGAALDASDRMIIASDATGRLASEAIARAEARRRAQEVLAYGALPARPGRGEGDGGAAPPYAMPADAALVEGVGSVNRDGVRARGVKLATARGQAVRAPAAGTIAFAGAYRRHDGVVILDHGAGRMTMLVGVRTDRRRGTRVAAGEELGIALGEIGVELVERGRPVSAPLAAVRSLSIQEKRR